MNETYQEVQERIARMRQNGATKPQTDYVMSQWFNSKNAETLKKKRQSRSKPTINNRGVSFGARFSREFTGFYIRYSRYEFRIGCSKLLRPG